MSPRRVVIVLFLWRETRTKATHKRKNLTEGLPTYSFWWLVHDHHCGKQTGMALEESLRVYILIHKQQSETEWNWPRCRLLKPQSLLLPAIHPFQQGQSPSNKDTHPSNKGTSLPTRTHPLQQGHTFSHKNIPPVPSQTILLTCD